MIKSVGIDFASAGEHKARCLDERAELCDGFSFQTTPDGLAKLEERIFRDGSNPVVVFEPTGLAWLVVAVYLKARHPDCRLVRVQPRKVATSPIDREFRMINWRTEVGAMWSDEGTERVTRPVEEEMKLNGTRLEF